MYKLVSTRRALCLAASFLVSFTLKAAAAPPCDRELCVKLKHLSGKPQFSIPPTKIVYTLELPEKPVKPIKVYVFLMRANTAGQFEIVSEPQFETMTGIQILRTWDPKNTPRNRKNSDRFVLMATFNPRDQNPREVTRDFSIKWGEQ